MERHDMVILAGNNTYHSLRPFHILLTYKILCILKSQVTAFVHFLVVEHAVIQREIYKGKQKVKKEMC